jgi:hypothetical protein
MTASDAVRDFVQSAMPGWRVQFGRWMDGTRTDRYAVIRPTGGLPVELVREPQFSISLIGAEGDSAPTVNTAADALIEAMRASNGQLVFMQPAEPVFLPTDDGRAVFEIAVSAITN